MKMKDILANLQDFTNKDKAIFISHMPPANLHLGQLVKIDKDIGSNDIYSFIEEKQPLLSLHGHIHEVFKAKEGKVENNINKTVCLNPGQGEFSDDILIYLVIDLDSMNIERKESKL
jgi:Icc-related predicted phosphoesterase